MTGMPRRVEDLPGEWRYSGTQLVYDCPLCRGVAKLYVAPDTGAFVCFRCDQRGRFDVGRNPDALRRRLSPTRASRGWPEANLPPGRDLGPVGIRFLADRYGLGLRDAKLYGLYRGAPDSGYEGRIVIPYFDRAGDPICYSGRSFVGEEPKYMGMPGRHPLYVPAYALGDSGAAPDLVLVEGAFDAIKVHVTTGAKTAALGGKSLPRYLLRDLLAMRPRRVRLLLDSDALAASLKLRAQLAPFVDEVGQVVLPAGDPASTPVEELRKLLS